MNSKIHTDQALNSKEDDELGRYPFAVQIAEGLITSYSSNNESLVIGINGAWGAGKSTLVNFIVAEIKKQSFENKLENPIILKFNPWMFSGQKELQMIFLKQLYSEFRKFDSEIGKLSEKFSAFLNKVGFLKYVHPGINEIAKDTKDYIDKLNEGPSLEDLKKDVDSIILENKVRLYIIIDDIDRLLPQEITEIFQMVKLNGNFANTTFILAYDKDVVRVSLETIFNENGEKYIEKIVQVDYSVPYVSEGKLAGLLENRLLEAFEGELLEEYNSSIPEIREELFVKCFSSIRDVYRFLNGIKLRIPSIYREVNISDFFYLECLRIFFPSGFDFVYKNKNELLRIDREKAKTGNESKEEKEKLLNFINTQNLEELCASIIKKLFVPSDNYSFVDFSNKRLIAAKNISHRYYFDRYFHLQLGEKDLGEKIFQTFINSDRVHRHLILDDVIEKEEIVTFLNWLPIKTELAQKSIESYVFDLFAYLNNLSIVTNLFLSSNTDSWIIMYHCSKGLDKIQNLEQRENLILRIFDSKVNKPISKVFLGVKIFEARERMKINKLYGSDLWSSLLIKNKSITAFMRKIGVRLNSALKKSFIDLITNMENYSRDELNMIISKAYSRLPDYYNVHFPKIQDNIDNLLDMLSVCISGSIVSGTGGSGFYLPKEHLFSGIDPDELYNRISSIKNFDELDENRAKSAHFYIKVYEDGFIPETYYNYESLEIVSQR